MKIGTQMGFQTNMDFAEGEEYQFLSDLGFQSVDYPLFKNYKDPMWQLPDDELKNMMENIKQKMERYGIVAGQTHAPLDAYWRNQPETKEARRKAQIQAIKAASYLGSPYIVMHPLNYGKKFTPKYYQEAKEINMEHFLSLKPYLEEYNVKAAIENMMGFDKEAGCEGKTIFSTSEHLKDYIDTLNSDRYVICLDVGHAYLAKQDPAQMIYDLGTKYLHVTHMHDNDGLYDDHLMPGGGKIDWYAIGQALHDIGFEGVFSFEAGGSFRRIEGELKKDLIPEVMKAKAAFAKAITKPENFLR